MADTGLGVLRMKQDHVKELTPSLGGGGAIKDVTQDGYILKDTVEKFEPGVPHIVGAVSLLRALEYIEHIGGYDFITAHDRDITTYVLERFQSL